VGRGGTRQDQTGVAGRDAAGRGDVCPREASHGTNLSNRSTGERTGKATGMDVYGKSPKFENLRPDQKFDGSIPGTYFRASIWGWPAIWEAAIMADPETAAKVEHPWTNDGDGLGEEDAKKLGEAIIAMLDDQPDLEKVESTEVNQGTEFARNVFATVESGALFDAIDREMGTTSEGPTTVLSPPSPVTFEADRDFLREFATFCIHSGGFEIW
jgi:hypothetical protein